MNEVEYPLLTPNELAAAGQALYGPTWRSALAHAFQVSEAVVAQVESGRAPAPPDWRARLVALAQDTALRALAAASDLLWCEEEGQGPTESRYGAPRYI